MIEQATKDKDASVELEPVTLKTISYQKAQTWSTPEEIRAKKQQKELEQLHGEVSQLRNNFSELVDLQRQQLKQMKELSQRRGEGQRAEDVSPAASDSTETVTPVVFPSRSVAPNPFEGSGRRNRPTANDRRGAEAYEVDNRVATSESTVQPNSVGTPSQQDVATVSLQQQLTDSASAAKPQPKTGLLGRLKKSMWKSHSQNTATAAR